VKALKGRLAVVTNQTLVPEPCSMLNYAPELADSSLMWQATPRASGLPRRQKETRSKRHFWLFTDHKMFFSGIPCHL